MLKIHRSSSRGIGSVSKNAEKKEMRSSVNKKGRWKNELTARPWLNKPLGC